MKANSQKVTSVTIKQKMKNRNVEMKKVFIDGGRCVPPLAPAATAEKVGPNEASILLCSEERRVGWIDRRVKRHKKSNFSRNTSRKMSIISVYISNLSPCHTSVSHPAAGVCLGGLLRWLLLLLRSISCNGTFYCCS